MRDLVSNIGVDYAVPPALYDADNAPAAVDLLGFDRAALAILVGAGGITFTDTNRVDFVIKHGDTATVAEHVAVEPADVLGVTVATGGIVKSLVAAHATADVTKLSYIGSRRYVSVLADFGGTHGTGTALAVVVLKGGAHSLPVT